MPSGLGNYIGIGIGDASYLEHGTIKHICFYLKYKWNYEPINEQDKILILLSEILHIRNCDVPFPKNWNLSKK